MQGIVKLNLFQFSTIYLLLFVVIAIMKKTGINQTKLLLIASFRMTVQLVLAGLILTYIFQNENPVFTAVYILIMIAFSIHRVLAKHPDLNNRFKAAIALSIAGAGIAVIFFFVGVVIQMDLLNPQYAIPISGMLIGNSMTGITLALNTFTHSLKVERNKIESLLNLGVAPSKILLPFVNQAIETALLPTMNSMLGMGIISLPGMMTGQILSGTLPLTAILYQIAIMIAICTTVCMTVFSSLYFGYKTLYTKKNQIIL